MKLEKWQREKLRELFAPFEHEVLNADAMVLAVEKLLSLEPEGAPGSIGNMLVEDAYKRFMAEWKQVGVWHGGKPVRAKLGRLIRDKKIGEVWAGLERLRNDPNRPAPEFVPRPMTWLNQERWNDDPYPAKGGRVAASGAVLDIQLDQHGMGSIEAIGGATKLRRDAGPGISGMMQQGRW